MAFSFRMFKIFKNRICVFKSEECRSRKSLSDVIGEIKHQHMLMLNLDGVSSQVSFKVIKKVSLELSFVLRTRDLLD